jgi:hypothetical protein
VRLAALRCVQSFGAGAPLSREGGASATAIDPAPGGGLLLDPNGSRRLDADSLRDGIG